MSLVTPSSIEGRADVFINNLITVFPDTPSNAICDPSAPLLAMYLLGFPIDPSKPLPRPGFVSWHKFAAEGTAAETQTVPGWHLNTRTLGLLLPDDKY
jgi:hypothetical protein